MKKLLTSLIVTALYSLTCLTSMPIVGTTNDLRIRGDINQDGKLNILDLLSIQKLLLGKSNTDTILETLLEADVNADQKFSTIDLLSLKRTLLGLENVQYIDNNPVTNSHETENYSSSYLSMTIPKGWKVEEGGLEMTHTLVVYDESNPQYQIFVRLKAEPILKSKASKEFWQFGVNMGRYMDQLFADAPYVENATLSDFYSNFNDFSNWAKLYTTDLSKAHLPSINDFNVISETEATVPFALKSGDVKDSKNLIASFNDDDGNPCKGAFSGVMVNFGDYIQDLAWFNDLFGTNFPNQLDTSYYMVYDMAFITTPEDSFDTDAQFLIDCLNTIQYSNEFVSNTTENIQNRTDYFNEIWSN